MWRGVVFKVFGPVSVDILAVAFLFFQRLDIFLGLLRALAAVFFDNLVEGGIDILRHPLRIAADIEIRAVLEPIEKLGAVLVHAVLHINFVLLIAGKCRVEPVKRSIRQRRLQFFAVEKIRGRALVAKEKPIPPRRPRRLALLQKRTERRNASSRADHDHRRVGVFRHAEMFRCVDKYRSGSVRAFGQVCRANPLALARAVVHRVAHDSDREVHRFADGFLRGGDGIKARLEFAEDFDKFGGRKFRGRKLLKHIQHIQTPQEILESGFFLREQEFFQISSRRIQCRHGLQELLRGLGKNVAFRQRLAERHLDGICARHHFVARKTQFAEHELDQLRIVRRKHPQRVAHFVMQP